MGSSPIYRTNQPLIFDKWFFVLFPQYTMIYCRGRVTRPKLRRQFWDTRKKPAFKGITFFESRSDFYYKTPCGAGRATRPLQNTAALNTPYNTKHRSNTGKNLLKMTFPTLKAAQMRSKVHYFCLFLNILYLICTMCKKILQNTEQCLSN